MGRWGLSPSSAFLVHGFNAARVGRDIDDLKLFFSCSQVSPFPDPASLSLGGSSPSRNPPGRFPLSVSFAKFVILLFLCVPCQELLARTTLIDFFFPSAFFGTVQTPFSMLPPAASWFFFSSGLRTNGRPCPSSSLVVFQFLLCISLVLLHVVVR